MKFRVGLINNIPAIWGAGNYAFMLHKEFSKTISADHVYLNYDNKSLDINGKVVKKVNSVNKLSFLKRAGKLIPKYNLYHFMNQNLSFLANKKNSIVTCHDIYPYLFPKNVLEKYVRKFLYSGMKRARKIIADSEHTKKDLVKHLKLDPEKIRVVHLGISDKFKRQNKEQARERLGLPRKAKIILHVGEVGDKRKNTKRVLKTFLRLKDKFDNLMLVRIGKDKIVREGVVNLYKISDEEMVAAYNAADVLLFPSIYEGFGLPPLEAMKCGLPVITAARTSIPEMVGDSAILINPYNEKEMEEITYKILTDASLSRKLSRKGLERVKKFTWENCAKEIIEEYKKLR